MKIAVTVVLYNPNDAQVQNLKTYCKLFDKVYAIDNSDNGFIMPKELIANDKIKYKSFGDNLGIARGLKTACEMAQSDGIDLLLTMDQDSKYPVDEHSKIINTVKGFDLSDIGIICLNTTQFKDFYSNYADKIFIDTWITSGNFIVLCNYFKTEGFDEKLFIDLVDFDLCHKFKNAGFKIVLLTKFCIIHEVGELKIKKILFKTVTFSDHSPIRYYYKYRNEYFLYHKDKKFFKTIHRDEQKHKLKMLLFGKDKHKKLKMIRRGIKDAKRGILGKYKE